MTKTQIWDKAREMELGLDFLKKLDRLLCRLPSDKKQCVIHVVSSSLSFKEQMKQDIIPRVWQMAEKEKEHLIWLIDNNAPKQMIETSRNYLSHFRQRHKEYIDYVAD